MLFPQRSLYIYGVMIFGIMAYALVWYVLHIIFVEFQSIGSTVASDLGTDSATYGYTTVETFFTNVDTYILALALVFTVIWALNYAQKKGSRM